MKTLIKDFTGRDWLFERIDNWLAFQSERFFILIGEPGVGISTISTQLIQRNYITAYHFCQTGDIETTKSSNILRSLAIQLGNLPNYSQALASTIKPVDLLAEVNCVESMTGSEIAEQIIENLAPNDPENELEILIRTPLTTLQSHPTNIVILIDSLYEAAITGDENIIRLFAQLSNLDLPTWVRFILTSRPNDSLLQEFSATPYYIENTSQENLTDVWHYVEERLKQFSTNVSSAPVISGILSSQIANLAKGNFLYTKLLIDNIVTKQFLDNLEALPKNIDDIYHRFLNGINIDERQNYQRILGILTVAQQPLTQEQLRNFTGIETDRILHYLEKMRHFLHVNDDEENKTYTIFHQSLRDYFLNKKRSGDFWCDASLYHNLIIQYYKQDTTWEELDFQKFDKYGLLYLVRHLDAARRIEEVFTLLTSSSKWMEVKFTAFSSNAPYIDDLELTINKFPKLLQPNQLRMLIQCYVALRNPQAGKRKQKRENQAGGEISMFFIEEEAPKL